MDGTLLDGLKLLLATTTLGALGWAVNHIINALGERFDTQDEALEKLAETHKDMTKTMSDLGIGLNTIQVTLIGPTGNNGLNSEVKELRRNQEEFRRAIAAMPKRATDRDAT